MGCENPRSIPRESAANSSASRTELTSSASLMGRGYVRTTSKDRAITRWFRARVSGILTAHTEVPEEDIVPTVSKTSTDKGIEFPVAEDRSSELDGYTVNFVEIRETHSLAPMLASLPGG